MNIFITGATGYVGRGVVQELVPDHSVVGLTRSQEKLAFLEELGAQGLVGDIRDPASYREAARAADALIHVAAERSGDKVQADATALEALLEAAAGGNASRVVYTSGIFVLGETGPEPVHEDGPTDGAPELVAWRPPHEERVLAAGSDAVATAVIRPGMVYGGRGGVFNDFFATAEEGAAAYVGDGANRWSPVYRGDVGRLYRRVIEERGQGIFHCAEGAAPVGRLAVAASEAAGAGPTRSIPLEDARETLGAFADALVMNQVMGCRRALELGWEPGAPFVERAPEMYREWKDASRPSGS